MLSFVVRRRPPRTRVAHLNRIYFDDGRSSIEFKSPSDRYLVINYWPPAAADEDVSSGRVPTKANCALAPGLHWHRHQDETFHILEGTAKFIFKGEESLAIPGNVVVIPKREFHTFCNASETHEMSVELVLEPGERERDEEFFSQLPSLPRSSTASADSMYQEICKLIVTIAEKRIWQEACHNCCSLWRVEE